MFCLQTKLYVFSANGRTIEDIIPCCNPQIYAATTMSLTNNPIIASIFSQSPADYKEDSVQIRNNRPEFHCASDSKILKPFGNGYEIGGLSLDDEGHRLAVVSKDACYLYLYIVC